MEQSGKWVKSNVADNRECGKRDKSICTDETESVKNCVYRTHTLTAKFSMYERIWLQCTLNEKVSRDVKSVANIIWGGNIINDRHYSSYQNRLFFLGYIVITCDQSKQKAPITNKKYKTSVGVNENQSRYQYNICTPYF